MINSPPSARFRKIYFISSLVKLNFLLEFLLIERIKNLDWFVYFVWFTTTKRQQKPNKINKPIQILHRKTTNKQLESVQLNYLITYIYPDIVVESYLIITKRWLFNCYSPFSPI